GSPAITSEALAQRLLEYVQLDYRVVLAYDTFESATRVRTEISSHGVPAVLHAATAAAPAVAPAPDFAPGAVHVVVRNLHEGFALPDARVLVATEAEITGRRSTRRRRPRRRGAAMMFEDLKAGDFIVHDVHGIGVFEGMARRKLDGVERDFLQLRYADGNLFMLSDQID
ncbi:MAG: CarD family transcriptional regulator, partial [Actinomycetota bacterium]